MSYYVVDRVSKYFVYVENEDGNMIKLDINEFDYKPSDGDAIYKNTNNKYVFDKIKTRELNETIKEEFEDLFT